MSVSKRHYLSTYKYILYVSEKNLTPTAVPSSRHIPLKTRKKEAHQQMRDAANPELPFSPKSCTTNAC